MTTPLYRSRTDRVLGGVCGGLAHALGVDPLLVRLGFVLLAMGGGAGVMLYVVLWLLIPPEDEGAFGSPETLRTGASTNTTLFAGLVLLVFGVGMLFMMGMHWFTWMHMGAFWPQITMGMHWFAWMPMGTLWPLLLIAGGVAMLLRRQKEL